MLWQEKEPQFNVYFNEQYSNQVGEFVHKSAYAVLTSGVVRLSWLPGLSEVITRAVSNCTILTICR